MSKKKKKNKYDSPTTQINLYLLCCASNVTIFYFDSATDKTERKQETKKSAFYKLCLKRKRDMYFIYCTFRHVI